MSPKFNKIQGFITMHIPAKSYQFLISGFSVFEPTHTHRQTDRMTDE